MTVNIQTDFLVRLARDLHENPTTFPTDSDWTENELIGYLNYAEQEFLQRSGIDKTDTDITIPPASTTIIFSRRISWISKESA